MARILISEPHDDVAGLLELLVANLGHQPVLADVDDRHRVDLGIVEPGDPVGLGIANDLRADGVPVVFVSIYPAKEEWLALKPSAFILKPFSIHTLATAVQATLAGGAPPAYP